MNRQTLLTLLLISAICTLANTVAGWVLLDLGGIASIVLSIIFLANYKAVFGPEAESARQSCLCNAIVNGGVLLLGGGLLAILAIFTLGIGLILVPVFQVLITLMNIAFGIWQLTAWSKLRNYAYAPLAA